MMEITYKNRVFLFEEDTWLLKEKITPKIPNKSFRDQLLLKLYSLYEGKIRTHSIPVKEVCKEIGLHPNSFWTFWTKAYTQKQVEEIGLKLRTRKPRKFRKYGRWNYPKREQIITNILRPVRKPNLNITEYRHISENDPIAHELVSAELIQSYSDFLEDL